MLKIRARFAAKPYNTQVAESVRYISQAIQLTQANKYNNWAKKWEEEKKLKK